VWFNIGTSELDAAKIVTGILVIKGFLEIHTKKENKDLSNAIAGLTSSMADGGDFAKLKMELFENVMPSVILDLKELLMAILVPSGNSTSGDGSSSDSLMDFVVPLVQLLPLATSQNVADLLPFLPPPFGSNQPVHLSPSSDFAFEYDVTPGLLSEFNFQHALVPYYRVAHPEGQQPDHSFAIGACAASAHQPKADFLKVFYATLGSFLTPVLAKSTREGNFPNHDLCCYFRGLTGEPRGACGYNKVDGANFTCAAPTWR